MSASVLTNSAAMVALQTLKSVNDDLSKTQTSISTGKEVGSAKDNSAVWAISKTMESDIAGFEAIEEGLSIGEATVAVASAGAEQIVEKLTEIKELIVSAQSENVDHGKIQDDISSKVDQVADTFYVKDIFGQTISDEAKREDVRKALLESLDE